MAKKASWVFGIIFIIAGVAGFIMQPALGFIAADTASNIIHLIVGIVLLAMASKPSASATLKMVGVIYIIWSILDFVGWNFTVTSGVTSWFYLIVGVVIAVLGWSKCSSAPSAPMPSSAPQM